MPDSLILQHKSDGILTITIERPQALNALNAEVIKQLAEAIDRAQTDSEVKTIVITGSGDKAFVAGADIKEFADYSGKEGKALAQQGQDSLFNRIERSSKPVIAAVNGFALGGGLELALACHIRIASDNARMGLPEVSLGVIPGYGGTQRLPQIVGKGKAMEMILSAKMMGARRCRCLWPGQCGGSARCPARNRTQHGPFDHEKLPKSGFNSHPSCSRCL